MKKVRWVSATAGAAMIAATLALPGAGVAYASESGGVTGNGNASLLSGNSVSVPISAPVNLCGVSLAVLGFSNSGCVGGASVVSPSSGSDPGNGNVTGDGNVGIGSGNTVSVPISAPVNVCGVSGAVGGSASSQCAGGASTQGTDPAGGSNGNVTGNGNASVLSGNSVSVPVTAPINVCGISLALLGFAESGCVGGAAVNPPPPDCDCMSQGTTSATPMQADGSATSQGTTSAASLQGTDPGAASLQGTDPGAASQQGTDPAAASLQGTGSGTSLRANGPDAQGDVNAVTTATTASMPSSGLPTTGANLLLLGVAALASIGVGAGTVALARRRRNGTAS